MNHETAERQGLYFPEPLTHRNKKGKVYQRLGEVDSQIQMALALETEELQARSVITDQTSPEFLKEECLVYLIRHHHKEGNRQCVNGLTESLLRRCGTWIKGQLCSIRDPELESQGYADVIAMLFERILDLDSDQGDFLQVRFWVVLKSLTVQTFSDLLKPHPGYDGEDVDAVGQGVGLRAASTVVSSPVETEVINESLIREALSQLEEPIRSAYLLRHYIGLQIEDQNPAVLTISRYFDKTPRTIRNWLTKADRCLAEWRTKERRDEQTTKEY